MVERRNEPHRGSRPAAARAGGQFYALSPLKRSELTRVLALEAICFRAPWSEESFREILADTARYRSLAARKRPGLLVGYLISSDVADELHVLNLCVHPDHRRQGIASKLLSEVHRRAIAGDMQFAYLEVRESNLRAQNLYNKFGYRRLVTRRHYYSDSNEDAICMFSDLTSKEALP